MTVTDELIAANKRYAKNFHKGDLPRRPARRVAILTCLDARINPARILGLADGDANVLRNAGGRAADAIRSLAISCHLLGAREIVVMHHTDCGLSNVTNDEIRASLSADLGPAAAAAAAHVDFLPFSNLDQSVRDDLGQIRASPLIPAGVSVRGFIYHVESGTLREVL